jgi:hypothetical protein
MDQGTESLTKELHKRTTEELIAILRNRDEEEWQPEVFKIVASVLKDRGILPDEVIAMGPEGVDVVESKPTVTIAQFFSPAEAHASRMALEEAGLAAWVTDEAGGTIYSIGYRSSDAGESIHCVTVALNAREPHNIAADEARRKMELRG